MNQELQERYRRVVSDAPEGSIIQLDEVVEEVVVIRWGAENGE